MTGLSLVLIHPLSSFMLFGTLHHCLLFGPSRSAWPEYTRPRLLAEAFCQVCWPSPVPWMVIYRQGGWYGSIPDQWFPLVDGQAPGIWELSDGLHYFVRVFMERPVLFLIHLWGVVLWFPTSWMRLLLPESWLSSFLSLLNGWVGWWGQLLFSSPMLALFWTDGWSLNWNIRQSFFHGNSNR